MSKGRGIVRLFGTDVPSQVPVGEGLREIKGISFSTSKAILKKSDVNPDKTIEELADDDIDRIKDIIDKSDLRSHLLNRRKDPEDGEDKHLVSSDLEIREKQDVDAMKKLGSYRGIRHRKGLPVRGQKTKSSFRGESSVGVDTSEIMED